MPPRWMCPRIVTLVSNPVRSSIWSASQLPMPPSFTWPKASGATTSDPLRIYDYPNLVVTAQPEFPTLPAQT